LVMKLTYGQLIIGESPYFVVNGCSIPRVFR